MKIRNGFVSNSSSSSFIVALKEIPKSIEDIKRIFFSDGRGVYYKLAGDGIHDVFTADEAAARIWHQIKDKSPMTKSEAISEFEAGWFYGFPDLDSNKSYSYAQEIYSKTKRWLPADSDRNSPEYKMYNEMRDKEFAEWKQKIHICAEKHGEELVNRYLGCYFFELEFGDESGEGAMEHGNAWRNVSHVVISHH